MAAQADPVPECTLNFFKITLRKGTNVEQRSRNIAQYLGSKVRTSVRHAIIEPDTFLKAALMPPINDLKRMIILTRRCCVSHA
jgi:hypothetical protein